MKVGFYLHRKWDTATNIVYVSTKIDLSLTGFLLFFLQQERVHLQSIAPCSAGRQLVSHDSILYCTCLANSISTVGVLLQVLSLSWLS